MSNRISVEDRLKKDVKRPVDKLFEPTEENTDDTKDEVKGAWDLRRQTYYVPEIIIDALHFKKAFENKDISEIVREALLDSLDDKYLNMAEEKNRNKK